MHPIPSLRSSWKKQHSGKKKSIFVTQFPSKNQTFRHAASIRANGNPILLETLEIKYHVDKKERKKERKKRKKEERKKKKKKERKKRKKRRKKERKKEKKERKKKERKKKERKKEEKKKKERKKERCTMMFIYYSKIHQKCHDT